MIDGFNSYNSRFFPISRVSHHYDNMIGEAIFGGSWQGHLHGLPRLWEVLTVARESYGDGVSRFEIRYDSIPWSKIPSSNSC